ncbi:MAG: F420-0--gamma-glutamyl ligase [Candidatus Portnoybacteria bacterium]|nr:F420-0--gamma-glutamyl ligase [Candidatus Portnoybacteria bacterium]
MKSTNLKPNQGKNLSIEFGGKKYSRLPVRTHLIHIKEPFFPIIEKYIIPEIIEGDIIAISEKFITISQGRIIHQSVVKPGLLAKLIVKGVKKYENDIGYSSPKKMQVAIMQAGWWRVFVAMIVGSMTKVLGRHGDFYRIAGHRISEIDGFNPDAIPPFNEYAMIGPENPNKTCQEIEDKFDIPTVIIDGNNINTEVLGLSSKVPFDKNTTRSILIDNPMGQGDELTPNCIIREIN